jgi:hypothetical protein
MTLLAVCDGNPEPGIAVGIVLGAVVIYVLPIGFLFGYVIPGGLSGDGNYVALFFAGTGLGAALGAIVAAIWDRVQPWRHILLGTLGGSAFLAFAIGLLIFLLTATGACLD